MTETRVESEFLKSAVELLEDGASDGAISGFKVTDHALRCQDPRGEHSGVVTEPTSNSAACSILTAPPGLNLSCEIVPFCWWLSVPSQKISISTHVQKVEHFSLPGQPLAGLLQLWNGAGTAHEVERFLGKRHDEFSEEPVIGEYNKQPILLTGFGLGFGEPSCLRQAIMAMSAARTFIGEAVCFVFQGSKIGCNSPAVPEKGQWSGSDPMDDHF
jgi:hypothetical protein